MSPTLHALPSLVDNYIWCLEADGRVLVVDPGDAAVVARFLRERRLVLAAILVTHRHHDHTRGLPALVQDHAVTVYGPDEGIAEIRQFCGEGDHLALPGFGDMEVLFIPGHTEGHIGFYLPGESLLFCGDTLFSAGCGRLLGGTMEQLFASTSRIARFPDDTRLCCSHEYTEANLHFAAVVEPGNPTIAERMTEVLALRGRGEPSLPVLLGRERDYNPFLRSHVASVIDSASRHAGRTLEGGLPTFRALREWKDGF